MAPRPTPFRNGNRRAAHQRLSAPSLSATARTIVSIALALTIAACTGGDYTGADRNQATPTSTGPSSSIPATRNPAVSDTRRPADGYAGFTAEQMNQAVQFLGDYIHVSNVDAKTVCVADIGELKRLGPYMTTALRADYERELVDDKKRSAWVSTWTVGECTTPEDGRAAENLQAQPVVWSGVPQAPNELTGRITFAVTLRTINPDGQLVSQRIHRDMTVTLQLAPDGWLLSDYGCDWRTDPLVKGG